MKHLRKCSVCFKYTLNQTHCSAATVTAHPPKYSIEDKYSEYRRRAKGL
ncbi:Ribosome biogenesis protein Nop10 [Candidatus Gugararchaeum adminiculabundum]|nr:Ribosome biogenesis protein Nop10 [Candidatus Gugararchaeum adminiculabundum]